MKRLIAILLVALTLVLALSSCGGKEQPTSTQEPETTQASPRPTTSKHVTVGIEEKDQGWSFWTEY